MAIIFSSLVVFFSDVSAGCGSMGSCGTLINGSEIGLGYTYRQDDIQYKFDSSLDCFTDSFEQTFNKIKIQQVSGLLKFDIYNIVYSRTKADFGWVFDGSTHHTSHVFDDTFKDSGCVTNNYVFDFSTAVGCIWDCGANGFKLIPLVGYAWDNQTFEAGNIEVVEDTRYDSALGTHLSDVHQIFKANWFGPWIGLDVILDTFYGWEIFLEFEYHWAEYRGSFSQGDFAINGFVVDSVDRHDFGCGQGFVGNIGLKTNCSCGWYGYIIGGVQAFNTSQGYTKDENNGGLYAAKYIDWKSYQGTIGFSYLY